MSNGSYTHTRKARPDRKGPERRHEQQSDWRGDDPLTETLWALSIGAWAGEVHLSPEQAAKVRGKGVGRDDEPSDSS